MNLPVPEPLAAAGVAEAVAYALPLRRRFRGTELREGVLLRGPSGWGEWAPFPEYDDATAARWLAAAIEQACGDWPAPLRPEIAVNAIIPALSPADAADLARRAYDESGCTTIKVKVAEVGTPHRDDVARLAAIAAALPDGVSLRIDANGGWRPVEAITALRAMADLGLEYVEQPCPTSDECARLRDALRDQGISTPIAIDEGLRRADDPGAARVHAQIRRAADIVIVKAAPLGGVGAAVRLVAAIGLPAVVSGALDSAVGLSAGLALAAALPQARAAGLGTGRLLARDVTAEPVVPRGGVLPVVRYAPDPAALAAVPSPRPRWWAERLARCSGATGAGAARGVGWPV